MLTPGRFIPYDYEELTALELIGKVSKENNGIREDLANKTDLTGDHKGSWQGIDKPVLADPGIANVVISQGEKLDKIDESIRYVGVNEFDGLNHADVLESLLNEGHQKIVLPKMTLEIDRVMKISKSNIVVDFSYSTIKWTNTTPLPDSKEYLGMLWFKGERLGNTTTITNYEQVDSEVGKRHGVVTVANSNGYDVGDFVELYVSTGAWATDYSNLRPTFKVMTRVVGVSSTKIYVEHYSPFNFKVGTLTGTIQKVRAVENVIIKNLNYVDVVPPLENDTRQTWASVVSLELCNNVSIENITTKYNKYPCFWSRSCRDIRFKNIESISSQTRGDGNGYILQLINTTKIIIDNVKGENCTHVIDLSGSSYAKVSNSSMGDEVDSNFSLHGHAEHDIIFENITTSRFSFGSGINGFCSMFMNITIKDSNFNSLKYERGMNCLVDNCRGVLDGGTLHVQGLTFTNCDLTFDLNIYSVGGILRAWTGDTRGTTSRVTFLNNRIHMKKTIVDKRYISFTNFDHVHFEGNIITSDQGDQVKNWINYIECHNCKHTQFINNYIENTQLQLWTVSDTTNKIQGNTFVSTLKGYSTHNMINFGDVSATTNVVIMLTNNVFDNYNETTLKARAINVESGVNVVQNKIVCVGNVLNKNMVSRMIGAAAIVIKSGLNLIDSSSTDSAQLFM